MRVWCQCDNSKCSHSRHGAGLCNEKVSSTTKNVIKLIGEVCDSCYSKYPLESKVAP